MVRKQRVLFLFGLSLMISFPVMSQFDFKAGAESESIFLEWLENDQLYIPDWDSIQFELRIWTFDGKGDLLILPYSRAGQWSGKQGFPGKRKMVMLEDKMIQEFERVWPQLDSLGILHLPPQDSLVYRYDNGERVLLRGPEDNRSGHPFVKRIEGAPTYVVELFASGKYRYYTYHNPIALSESFGPGTWESPETTQFAAIVRLLNATFDLEKMWQVLNDPTEEDDN